MLPSARSQQHLYVLELRKPYVIPTLNLSRTAYHLNMIEESTAQYSLDSHSRPPFLHADFDLFVMLPLLALLTLAHACS